MNLAQIVNRVYLQTVNAASHFDPEYWCGNLTGIATATIISGLALCTYL